MKTGKLTTNKYEKARRKIEKNLRSSALICGFIFLFLIGSVVRLDLNPSQKVSAEDFQNEIENAVFARQEFFGAQAIVPLPTDTARENLARLAESSPDNPQILLKLADANEKLSQFDAAEKNLIRLAKIDSSKNETLVEFYERHAEFEKEAAILEKILFTEKAENRPAIFERLIETARQHDIKNYLQPEFYDRVARENPSVFAIFRELIKKFSEEKNYAEALNFTRQAKRQFPEQVSELLDKEIEILLEMKKSQEAEAIYQAAFNPFWSEDEAQKFYDFLSNQDHLRVYGAELKTKFKSNPADFETAIRLALYQKHDYSYGNDSAAPVITKLEVAKKNWTSDELVTVARLLIKEGAPDTASRFLYTLYLRGDLQEKSERRAKILYQLFELFSDAETQKLSLTKGDLSFYEDVAKADRNPGITTGILSLLFSDTNPKNELDAKAEIANGLFNRAAAYRIFLAYKEEYPTSNELAQMYLDVVRFYAAAKKTEIAEKTLNEFEQRYENASDYPAVALKLADAFAATKQTAREREIYQKVLDYLGKQDKPFVPPTKIEFDFSTDSAPQKSIAASTQDDGINIPSEENKSDETEFYSERTGEKFHDYLDRRDKEIFYQEVLDRFVNSLAKEKKTAEILEFYSNEIGKYPNEEWLYQQRLTWLEQTNLAEEELKVYQQALNRFQTNEWRDKLARWFLRKNRQADFAEFSENLIGKLNDADVENYLAQFVDSKISAADFDKRLYLKLYNAAHERFPHNLAFVNGLLKFYKENKRQIDWRDLAAAYYFESKEIRDEFLENLSEKGELRNYLEKSETSDGTIYELFRADAFVCLSDFENAVAAYRKLNRLYPNTPEFAERLLNLTRSFGQRNREFLTEASTVSKSQADFSPASSELRTRSGELFAELGDYKKAGEEWEKTIRTAQGDKEIYLDAATVYWDYFQYDDALKTIKNLREKFQDDALYAFEAGAILESKHETENAIAEYVKALDAGRDDEEAQKEKATKRLAELAAKENLAANIHETTQTIESAFETEKRKRKDSTFLSLGYAEFLVEIKEKAQAEKILNQAIAQSRNKEFLDAVKDFYDSEEMNSGEQVVLKRLAETTANSRQTIAYRLQLAQNFSENKERDSAKAVLAKLVENFPTNYGVLTESSNFYWRLGFENESVQVLQNALPRSRGAYRSAIAERLAKRLVTLNRLDSAETILISLHDEDKADMEIFRELAGVCVRTNKPELLRKIFGETVAALRQTNADRREIDAGIADLRVSMIDAFTRLADYNSAIEQHIEIINREPDDEAKTDAAISYVERYGGAETLLNYYRKTSAEAYKNYRWNVVLARIYAAGKDWENAVKNYRAAIINQPEMPELYLAIADIETKRNDYGEAIKNLDRVLELTNDAPEYVKRKIEVLKRAGRLSEIEAERAKLPAEEEKKITVDSFAEARNLQNTEREKARTIYREAFNALLENPLSGELSAANITGYVSSLREEESLNTINERVWQLREKLIAIADETDSTKAGEARKRLEILDGALIESVGGIAKTVADEDELATLHADLSKRIEQTSLKSDAHKTVSLVQDLSRRAGFGDLEEKILIAKTETANTSNDERICLSNLVNFYNERGAYQKTFDALEKFGSGDLSLKVETARLIGNREKEIEILRTIYQKPDENFAVSPDADVARYLEILYAENRGELKSITEKSSAFQLQLINFLLGKGERELAHAAIENADLPQAWKASRNAETSLALMEFGAKCYFCAALRLGTIGEMTAQTPDKNQFLINDDWFHLSREYGEWLAKKNDSPTGERKLSEADRYLPAMTENRPNDTGEQLKMGEFYLEENDLKSAIEHLRLASEMNAGDKTIAATLGAAYYKIGRRDYAAEIWTRVTEDKEIESGSVYFQTLRKYGLSSEARKNLPPIIAKFLETNNADQSEDFQNLIRAAAESLENETEKAAYFKQILMLRPTDKSLAAMLVGENLIAENQQDEFYELLIGRGESLKSYDSDYQYESLLERVWGSAEADEIFDQESDYKTDEPENERYDWQKKYLEHLVKRGENPKAEQLISEIEKELNGKYARPAWLRLAKIQMKIRGGVFDSAQIERFVGIRVPDSATEIKPPSVERFNDILSVLKKEKRDAETLEISESFFARMLALEQTGAANLIGLARVFFQANDTKQALRILQLMIDASDETKAETARAEIAAIDVVKAQAADAAKFSTGETTSTGEADALKLAAEIAFEFNQTDAAITFRRQLFSVSETDAANRIELAELLSAKGEKEEAANLLTQVAGDRNALRKERWRAVWEMKNLDANREIKNINFDSLSQFYNGLLAENNGRADAAIAFFVNALIADKDEETTARHELIKLYAVSGKPFAALKLAGTDKTAKSDALLETLSEAAEKTNDFARAIEFERAKSAASEEKITRLKQLADEKNRRATDFTVDAENTRKL
ncbi:MAG: hypothetical protein ACR2HG_08080 [Pyrinomonadaceae bacterium]